MIRKMVFCLLLLAVLINGIQGQEIVPPGFPSGADGAEANLIANPNSFFTGPANFLAGATTVTLMATGICPSSIQTGDLLLVIQMQGADIDNSNTDAYGDGVAGGDASGWLNNANYIAGQWEYVVVQNNVGCGGGALNFCPALTNSYVNEDYNGTQGQKRYQIIRVPQYTNLTLGANVEAEPWNGEYGGVLAVHVQDDLDLNGFTLDVSSRGFRGGTKQDLNGPVAASTLDDYVMPYATDAHGLKGEGIAGTPRFVYDMINNVDIDNTLEGYPAGSKGYGAPGNAGGGATDAATSNRENSGGGGGGNGGRGGKGGNTWSSNLPLGGYGGSPLTPNCSGIRLIMGGGGGAGTINDDMNGGDAGTGGGIAIVHTGNVTGAGTIHANGADAIDHPDNDGGGGGGAGGSIVFFANAGHNIVTATARGGDGADAEIAGDEHGPGGGGGGGIIWTNAAFGSFDVSGGANGITDTGLPDKSYGATSGENGLLENYCIPPDADTSFTICQGESVQLVTPDSNGTGYTWSPAASLDDPNIKVPTATPNVTTQYVVTITDACFTWTDTVVVTVNPLPTLTPAQTNVSCNGGNDGVASVAPGGGTPDYSYLWPGGGTDSALTGISIGSYRVTVTDDNNCSDTVSINITEPPVLTLTPAQTNVSCNGGNDGVASVAPGGGTPVYNYSWPGGGTDSVKTGLNPGSYRVTVADNIGCNDTVSIDITEPPALTLTPAQTNVSCNGSNDGIASVAPVGGAPGYNYSWPGGGTDSVITGITQGSYRVTVTDNNSCSDTVSIDITEPPAISLTFTENDATCGDSNGFAIANISGGTPGYSYLWQIGATDSLATGLAAGNYTVTVTDSKGCTISGQASVSNINGPVIVLDSIEHVSCNGGNGGEINLTVAGTALPLTFNWSNGDTTEDLTGLTAGNYGITVTDTNNCTATGSYTVNEPFLLSATLNQTDSICAGSDNGAAFAVVNGGTPGYTFLWNSGQTDSTLTSLSGGTYIVTVTDINNCTLVDSATITEKPLPVVNIPDDTICSGSTLLLDAGNSGAVYNWSTGANSQTITVNTANTYWVEVDLSGCIATDTVTIREETITPLFSGPDTLCHPAVANFIQQSSVNGTIISYKWNYGDGTVETHNSAVNPFHSYSAPGVYIIKMIISTQGGCRDSLTQTLVINPLNLPDLGNDTIICSGDSLVLTPGIGADSYLWSNGSTAAQLTVTGDTTIWVEVDIDGCIARDTIRISTHSLFVEFTGNDVCIGNTTSFNDSISGNVTQLLWNFGDGNTSSVNNPQYIYQVEGNYTVILAVANAAGCTDTVIHQVSVFNNPVVTVVPDSAVVWAGKSIQLSAQGAPLGAVFEWMPPDGLNNPYASNPIATPNAVTTYAVIITDTNGCTATDSTYIDYRNNFEAWFPNTFSPNGDGLNDRAFVQGFGVAEIEFIIFNRWGEIMYEAHTVEKAFEEGWDGTFMDEPVDIDNYAWYIRAVPADKSFKPVELQGSLFLAR